MLMLYICLLLKNLTRLRVVHYEMDIALVIEMNMCLN
jgi:hypothetical protein